MKTFQVNFKKSILSKVFINNRLSDFLEYLTSLRPIDKILLVTDEIVESLYTKKLSTLLDTRGYQVYSYVLEIGRKNKKLRSIENIMNTLFKLGADRNSLIINVGGGVVGDIGGFAASLYMRGIRYIHMPTTLLSQVDSSIGGKVGVNLSKNLNGIGQYYYPVSTWVNTDYLESLPKDELIAGFAEVIKYATILDSNLFNVLEENIKALKKRDKDYIDYIVQYCIQKKTSIVSADPKEIDQFKLFTYGHEIGHALEVVLDYQHLRHGEAVAIGMMGSAWLGRKMKLTDNSNLLLRQKTILSKIGLPTNVPKHIFEVGVKKNIFIKQVIQTIEKDKKRENHRYNWILATDIGQGICTDNLDRTSVLECMSYLVN